MQLGKIVLITTIALGSTACVKSLSSQTGSQTASKAATQTTATSASKAPPTEYVWLVVGANNQQYARVVTDASSCPYIELDNHASQMSQRAKGNQPVNFSEVISCETAIAATVKSASVNGTKLNLFNQPPQKIIVMGDTGCRIKKGDYQNCNDLPGYGPAWPFAKLAKLVEKANPDLIIHLGDYHYREIPCPAGNEGCAGPAGMNWPSWQADFFEPAKPILAKFPWVLTRGNHEDCERSFRGWFYLLDPAPLAANLWQTCPDYTQTYPIDLGNLTLIQMDSATLPNPFNPNINPATVKLYANQFDSVNALADKAKNSWFVTHRPTWAVSSYFDWRNNVDALATSDPTMQADLKTSKKGRLAESINLTLSGHMHSFQTMAFDDGQPSALIVGGSGTKLSPAVNKQAQAEQNELLATLGVTPPYFYRSADFAYAMLERQPHDAWIVRLVDLNGKTRESFVLSGKRLERIWE
ncbi:MAG: metallophosphoesterase [Algicola sp.]|nr:metallophosphoesterase [Algicola sp.]